MGGRSPCRCGFVLDGKTLWLLPVRGSRNQWFRNVVVNPKVTVKAGRARETFRARPVRDRAVVRRAVARFKAKYSRSEIARYYSRFDAAVRVAIGSRK